MTKILKCYIMKKLWGYGSVGRAPRSQRGGQRFESAYLHQNKKHAFRGVFLVLVDVTLNRCGISGSRERCPQTRTKKRANVDGNALLWRSQNPLFASPFGACFCFGGRNVRTAEVSAVRVTSVRLFDNIKCTFI